VDVLIAAMRRFRGDDGVRLYVRGSGSLEPALRKAIAKEGLTEQVTLLPPAAAECVAADLVACDCLVIPSRSESIPVVFSEAIQAGTPLLVTDVGDMGMLARENHLMSPVPPGNAEALADAMAAFMADVDGHRRRFDAARGGLLRIFDVDAIGGRLVAALVAPAA
jgi:glycosyltransferase involved in cell wall biosynthesis